ncbi:MAG TPA: hypothetical protein VFM94_11420 [Solirubrobacterales bacterium]|nr:hypothetical protein [Solirubrobacterales bacterium]
MDWVNRNAEWLNRNAPVALLGMAMVASVALLLVLTREMTFLQDTWEFLMNRRDFTADALLRPHNEHIVVIPVAIEQVLLRVFGMSDARPEYVLLAVSCAVTAALLFVYVRRRVGPWLALIAAVLLLFLGPAWEALLWPFEISFVGSVLFGLAMLLALDREDRRGDIAATAFLCLSFGFSSVAIPFAAAAAVDVFQKRRSRGLARAYLVAVPVVLYGIWYLGWGSDAETHVSLHNVLASPRFVFESAAVAVGSVFGLGTTPYGGSTDPVWGRAILVALVVVFAYRQVRKPGVAPGFWPVAAATATNWFLTAFNQIPGRDPTSSRYQYMGGVLVLLLLANLLQGVRFGKRALIAVGGFAVAAVAVNLIVLQDGRDVLEQQSQLTKGDLGAIEIAKRTVDPEFSLNTEVAGTTTLIDVQVAKYLPAVEEYGSPAYTPSELAAAPDYARHQADIVLSQALPLSTFTRLGAFDPGEAGENCIAVPGNAPPDSEVRLSPGLTRIELAPGPQADFTLRRFATGEFPVATEGAPGDSVTLLRLPRDAAPQYPWFLHVAAAQPARVCR